MMRKQLNNYDGVLSQFKGTEEIEMGDVDKNKENTTKTEPKENEDEEKSVIKEKVEENIKTEIQNTKISPEVSENDKAVDNKYKARWIDLGFMQSKLIKNIFCCLSERQQIGKKIFPQFILSSLTSSQDSSS